MLFWKRKVFVFAALLYQGFLLEGGRAMEMLVGVWSVTWPPGIIAATLFYSVEAAWHKPLRLHKSFLYIQYQKWKRIDLLSFFKAEMSFGSECAATATVRGRGLHPGQVAAPSKDTRLNFAPNLNARYHICNAPQHARCRAAHLHSHFDSSCLWWPSMARMQNCGSDGFKGRPLDYVTTLSIHRVLNMHLIRLLYPNEIVQGLAFVPLSPRSHLWCTWCFASD